MDSENEKRKDDIYSTTCFSVFPFFILQKKHENMYHGSYFYFSFFVCRLRKKKRILRYPFPIFYHKIEKRKTKGRYIHGPREHSMSQLCSIDHDIPVTLHILGAYVQWSVFDHNGDKQSVVLRTRYGIWWPSYGQSLVITTSSALVRCWNFFGGPNVGFRR